MHPIPRPDITYQVLLVVFAHGHHSIISMGTSYAHAGVKEALLSFLAMRFKNSQLICFASFLHL